MIRSRAKGTRLESVAKRRLENKGYVVIRAAGSHGPFDLVALKRRGSGLPGTSNGFQAGPDVLCVQVKANRKPTKRHVEAMSEFLVASEVWVHRDRASQWDVYEPTPSALESVRQEPYVPTTS